MGTARAVVAGSGSCPAWMASVPRPGFFCEFAMISLLNWNNYKPYEMPRANWCRTFKSTPGRIFPAA
jgi:hypothetical protein